MKRRTAFRDGAFADVSDLNPWLLTLRHLDSLAPQPNQIGFKTNAVRHANRHLDPERGVGEAFLANTRLHTQRPEWDASAIEYFTSSMGPVIARSGSESVDASTSIGLPDPTNLHLPLGSLLDRRRSIRSFSGDPIDLADLGTILHAAAGITHTGMGVAIDRPVRYHLHFRTVPSSGGLYAVRGYCFCFKVRHLPTGVYRYLPWEHRLARIASDTDEDTMLAAFMQAEASGVDLTKVAAALVFVGNPQKLVRKYGGRGVRYLLLETGMMSFSANLAAGALGWGALDYQSFYEPRVEACLALRNRQSYVLHALLLGWPAGEIDEEV